ncbi:MAG: ABC transporter permease [Deinococcota bacterium]
MTLAAARWQRATYLRDLLRELVGRELKLRYKRSALGIAWSLLVPLAQLLVFVFLSHSVLRLNISHYPVFVFVGLLSWNWFQSSLLLATGAVTDNRMLIRRPGFPAAILPAVTVITGLIHYLLALPVLLVFAAVSGVSLTPALLAFPLIVTLQFLLTLGLTYLLASLHVAFRDLQHLLGILLMLLFYLTPVFYSPNNVPTQYHALFHANPVAVLLEALRRVLLDGQWPEWRPLLGVGVLALALLALGYAVFSRTSERFVEEL